MAGSLVGFGCMFTIMGAIWLIIEAFRTSNDWGLVSLLVPFGVVVFAVKKWDRAKAPTLMLLAGIICFIIGIAAVKAPPADGALLTKLRPISPAGPHLSDDLY